MKIIIHDYAGHPFQVLLSKRLAELGHEVAHLYFADDPGPKGNFSHGEVVLEKLTFIGINLEKDYSKSNLIKRWTGDISYGRKVAKFIEEWAPDVVFSGNTPLDAQRQILKACGQNSSKFVFWIQDFYSIAIDKILRKKIPFFGAMLGAYYKRVERHLLARSDAIVVITESFKKQLSTWAIAADRTYVIPNWGALTEIPEVPAPTKWQREMGFDSKIPLLVYTGTLALKHNPELLVSLAKKNKDAKVVVIASGVGVDVLVRRVREEKLQNVEVMPLQPFELLPQVLGSASALIAIIERDAGEFSVPSKVLSYLCAGRPIILAAPVENLASQIITDSRAGMVAEPEDIERFSNLFKSIKNNKVENYGANARQYAEANFDIRRVAERFEKIASSVTNN